MNARRSAGLAVPCLVGALCWLTCAGDEQSEFDCDGFSCYCTEDLDCPGYVPICENGVCVEPNDGSGDSFADWRDPNPIGTCSDNGHVTVEVDGEVLMEGPLGPARFSYGCMQWGCAHFAEARLEYGEELIGYIRIPWARSSLADDDDRRRLDCRELRSGRFPVPEESGGEASVDNRSFTCVPDDYGDGGFVPGTGTGTISQSLSCDRDDLPTGFVASFDIECESWNGLAAAHITGCIRADR